MGEDGKGERGLIAVLTRAIMSLLLTVALTVSPAFAQSILRDAETEALLADISKPLIQAAGLDPRNVQVVMILDKDINAFVAGGQVVYIHSGLITAADNANQVQGVIAHELGHIEGGHAIRINEGAKAATGVTILSLILGVAAMAAGAGEAGAGIMAAGQQAAMGKFLSFTRTQESSADAAGVRYLAKAGISGRGSLEFFKKLQGLEFRLAIPQEDSYARTHPLNGERIEILRAQYEASPAWSTKTDPALEARFQRVRAKLKGYVSEPNQTLTDYPEGDNSVPARYARAYAWHQKAYPDKALGEVNALLAASPHDPYFLELEGQVLLESGRPADAIPALREASERSGYNPLITAMFGHALIATENDANFPEAEKVLRAAIARDDDNPFAWYQLGVVYEHKGDTARAALASAERYNLEGNSRLALANANMALAGIPQGTTDYLRAQDIAMVSKFAFDEEKHNRK